MSIRELVARSFMLVFLSVLPAHAATIQLTNCDASGCQGTTLELDVVDLGGSFDITLTINADAYTGSRLGFNQVGFLAIQNWTSVSLVSSPTTGWSAPTAAVISSNGTPLAVDRCT